MPALTATLDEQVLRNTARPDQALYFEPFWLRLRRSNHWRTSSCSLQSLELLSGPRFPAKPDEFGAFEDSVRRKSSSLLKSGQGDPAQRLTTEAHADRALLHRIVTIDRQRSPARDFIARCNRPRLDLPPPITQQSDTESLSALGRASISSCCDQLCRSLSAILVRPCNQSSGGTSGKMPDALSQRIISRCR